MANSLTKTLILLSFSGLALASGSSSSNTAKKTKEWSLSIKSTTSQNLYDRNTTDYVASNVTKFTLGIKFGSGSLRTAIAYNKALTGEYQGSFGDLSFSYLRKLTSLNGYTTVHFLGSLGLPTTSTSKEDTHLRTKFTALPILTWDMAQIGMNGFTFTNYTYAVKSFHKYEVSYSGSSNIEWAIGNDISLAYDVNSWLSLDLSGSYARSITYKGTERDSYSLGQGITFTHKTTSLTLGHEVGGSPLAPSGQDTQVDIFDRDKATVFAELNMKI